MGGGLALERLTGFGGTCAGVSRVLRPAGVEALEEALHAEPRLFRTLGLRGAGRSYGDAALNNGGTVLDVSGLDRVEAWDPQTGCIDVQPGVTIEGLWRHTLADGWWPAVVPGTMRATLGGCVAMNVHGKNCFRIGPIGDHVEEIELILPTSERVVCAPDRNEPLFRAVIGGFGMLGCIVRIRLRLKRVHSGSLRVRALPTRALAEMFDVFEEHAADADYLVGWCDGTAVGSGVGRGVVHRADHRAADEDADAARGLEPGAQDLPRRLFGLVPRAWAVPALRAGASRPAMRAVNALKYAGHRSRPGHRYLQSHVAFHFLLDYVPGWERMYGRAGLIQIQPFLPRATAREAMQEVLRLARGCGLPPYLVVFKQHRPDRFLLSHGLDGFSLAMDFPARPRARVRALARDIQELTLDAGGRFYVAKDSTLTPEQFQRALPAESLRSFRELKRKVDPEGLLQTDLARRLWPELLAED